MVDVGIVILNWNGYKDTLECLESINNLDLRGTNLRVLLVDNASSDNSVVEIKNKKSKIKNLDIKVLVNNDNLGFAGGNNVGIRYLLKKKVSHILILNNDTLVDKKFVFELVNFTKYNPGYGILSPKIYFAQGYEFHKARYKKNELGKVIWAAGGEMDWNNVFGKNRGVDEVDQGQYDKSCEIDFATGAAMLVNSKLLNKIELFDEKYFMYFEDADFVTRSTKSGFKNYYVPKAMVWHKVAQSSAIGGNLNDYFITRNRLLFGSKYTSIRTKFALYRESIKFLFSGRYWQRKGVLDFYLKRFGKGSWSS